MVKAASLLYALLISLLVGVLCYALLLLFTFNLELENHFEQKNKLLSHNQFSTSYFLHQNPEDIFLAQPIFDEESNIVSSLEIRSWGMFNLWRITSRASKDSLSNHILVSRQRKDNTPAIYLRDDGSQLQISGTTLIEGDVLIPSRGVKKTVLSGQNRFYDPKVLGSTQTASRYLPDIENFHLKEPTDFELFLLKEVPSGTFVNSFENPTKVIEVSNTLQGIHLKGNIRVRSKDTLHVLNDAILEDIIVEAPKVIFQKGFRGSLQVFASTGILLEEAVTLEFPSVLVINNINEVEEREILIGEGSKVTGSVILLGNGLETEPKNTLKLEKDSKVTGEIYCDGIAELYGELEGNIFTSAFRFKNASTEYRNLLFNATIKSLEDPHHFFQLFSEEESTLENPCILKKL